MSEEPPLPIARSILIGSLVVWAGLLPMSALLGGHDTFGARLSSQVVNGVIGTAFALFVGGLLLDRWKEDQRRRAKEQADADYAKRTKFLVADLLVGLRAQLVPLVLLTYDTMSTLLDQDQVLGTDHLAKEIMRPSGTSITDELGPDWSGPLRTAESQAGDIRSRLVRNLGTRTDQYVHEAYRESPPEEAVVAATLEPAVLQAFIDRAAKCRDEINSRGTAICTAADEFYRWQRESRPEVIGPAVVIRRAARDWDRALSTASNYSEKKSPQFAGMAAQARTAAKVAVAGTSILDHAGKLVSHLWHLELEFKRRLPPDDGLLRLVGEQLESSRQLQYSIDRRMWEFERPNDA
jgi:hypothetical protein